MNSTEIVYLLGAGASYGMRDKEGDIIRGLPIVNEMANEVEKLRVSLIPKEARSLTDIERFIINSLTRLRDNCINYPTIDTYAKQLYVTHRQDEYEQLKKDLTIFFTLMQEPRKKDLRYDGFIASLVEQGATIPTFPSNVKILSWNYDSQIEFTFSNYLEKHMRTIWHIYYYLNVRHKFATDEKRSGFEIIKLNGTAYPTDRKNMKAIDYFLGFDISRNTICERLFERDAPNILSFAWEQDENFYSDIADEIKNATTLVIIGYSFPYVNRKIDRMLIQSMENLKNVYIQDLVPELIEESFNATLSEKQIKSGQIKCKHFRNVNQFIIPRELQ